MMPETQRCPHDTVTDKASEEPTTMTNTTPTPGPYDGYLARLTSHDDPEAFIADRSGAGAAAAEAVHHTLEGLAGDLIELSHTVHANPELGFEEHHAVAAVAETVRRHGIDIEVGVYGLETAFRAIVGDGSPRVAILAEYDALPGIGHGCGHNVICAAGVGGFLAAAPLVAGLGGSIELIGTPAEEGGSGKELIARAGGFDQIDCAMMVHPAGSAAAACTYLGMRQVVVEFHGVGAHASAFPFMGRNALDACVAAYNMISQLRQHILSDDRIHGIITDGGTKPNIVPDHAAAHYYVRSREIDTLVELTRRIDEIFRAAAAGTGTTAELHWDVTPLDLPVRNNLALANRFALSQSRRGKPMPLRAPVPSGSTDMGNISVRVPSIHPKVAISPKTVAVHTAEFADYAGSPSGDEGALDGAYGLAMTALDYLADPELRADVAAEFAASGGVIDVVALDR
jgi:amidohydrolase